MRGAPVTSGFSAKRASTMACSARSRLQKPSYSAHSRSAISLTAARYRSLRPVSSVNASSMSHVDKPLAWSSTASRSSSRVAPKALPARSRRTVQVSRGLAAQNIRPPPQPSSPCQSDNRCGSPPFRPRPLDSARDQARQRPRPPTLPRQSAAAPDEPSRLAPPPSPSLRSSMREAPRACALARIVSASECSLGPSAPTESPLSCFTSGRVHSNPISSKPYALTQKSSAKRSAFRALRAVSGHSLCEGRSCFARAFDVSK
jgi:hypothetical protein